MRILEDLGIVVRTTAQQHCKLTCNRVFKHVQTLSLYPYMDNLESVLFNGVPKKKFDLAMFEGQAFSGAPSFSDRRECDLLWLSILHWVHAAHRWSDSSSFQHKSQWIRSEELHKFGILQELWIIVDILQLAWCKGKTVLADDPQRLICQITRSAIASKQSDPNHFIEPLIARPIVSTELGQLGVNCCCQVLVLPSFMPRSLAKAMKL